MKGILTLKNTLNLTSEIWRSVSMADVSEIYLAVMLAHLARAGSVVRDVDLVVVLPAVLPALYFRLRFLQLFRSARCRGHVRGRRLPWGGWDIFLFAVFPIFPFLNANILRDNDPNPLKFDGTTGIWICDFLHWRQERYPLFSKVPVLYRIYDFYPIYNCLEAFLMILEILNMDNLIKQYITCVVRVWNNDNVLWGTLWCFKWKAIHHNDYYIKFQIRYTLKLSEQLFNRKEASLHWYQKNVKPPNK